MEDSSDTRTETIGGVFLSSEKEEPSFGTEEGRKNMRRPFFRAGNRHFFACLIGKRVFFRGATWINDKKLSRYLKLLEGGDGFFCGKSQWIDVNKSAFLTLSPFRKRMSSGSRRRIWYFCFDFEHFSIEWIQFSIP